MVPAFLRVTTRARARLVLSAAVLVLVLVLVLVIVIVLGRRIVRCVHSDTIRFYRRPRPMVGNAS